MSIKKPLLAGKVENIDDLKYPVYATPKLDGIRCLIINGKAVTRQFKPVPNRHVRDYLENYFVNSDVDLDGELMLNDKWSFNDVSSAIMSEDGQPDFKYIVFDCVKSISDPYLSRMDAMGKFITENKQIKLLLPVKVKNAPDLLRLESEYLNLKYEGVMIRSHNGPYKEGRSTEKEGILLKLKQFADGEAVIIGFEEMFHNENVKELDAFGNTKRSSKKSGMVSSGSLGAFVVKDMILGIDFKISSGLTESQRFEYWSKKDNLLGLMVKYKHQPPILKDRPRFPVFLGFRSELDM